MKDQTDQDNRGLFSWVKNFFNCCNPEDNDINDLCTIRSKNGSKYLSEMQKALEKAFSFIPIEFIREEERPYIKFTKEGLLDFILKLQADDYNQIFDEEGLLISIKDSSVLNSNNYLMRCQLFKPKSFFSISPGIQKIADAIALPEERKNWDKNIKEYKVMEKINDRTEILKMITSKQFSIIEEKEFLDKRTRFWDEGVYYSFSSSIPDKVYTPNGEIDRAKDYMGIIVISEDEENYNIDCFNQVDIKVGIPESFITENFPPKIKEFFESLSDYINSQ